MDFIMTIGPKGQVVIPKPFRDEYGLVPGSEVIFSNDEKTLTISSRRAEREKWVKEMEEFARQSGKKNVMPDPHSAYEEELDERWNKLVKRGIVKK